MLVRFQPGLPFFYCLIHYISGAPRCDNRRLYHTVPPLQRQNLRFCLYVLRYGELGNNNYACTASRCLIELIPCVSENRSIRKYKKRKLHLQNGRNSLRFNRHHHLVRVLPRRSLEEVRADLRF